MSARTVAADALQDVADRLDPEGAPPVASDPPGTLEGSWKIARGLGDVVLKEERRSQWTKKEGNCTAEIYFTNRECRVWAKHTAPSVGEALSGAINEARRLGASPRG